MDRKMQNRLRRISAFVLIAAFGAIIGIMFASKMQWTDVSAADDSSFMTAANPLLTEEGESPFVAVAEKLKPAVVSISSEREEDIGDIHDYFDFGPFKDFFRDQRPDNQPRSRKVQAGGTGIIVSRDGYILTNNHLVEDAADITVRLSNDDEYEAEIIGTDPVTDVALIKLVKANLKPEQVAYLGDSDKIKIGDWAIAIGSPFGLDWTVTVGVISAKGRGGLNIGGRGPDVQYFIQTDAAINFGNSGGPLVNIKGEVIGINTAINAQGQGIGFAIPINMAREVAEQLKERGSASHGYLGIYPVELSPGKKEALGLDMEVRGVFVDQVVEDTPADLGGLVPGDVIIEFEGTKITNVAQFRSLVASKLAGEKVSVIVLREGREKRLKFELGDRAEVTRNDTPSVVEIEAWLGIHVESLNSGKAQQWGIKEESGVLVTEVERNSSADGKLRAGDVIIEIDKRPVKDVKDFRNIAADLKDREKSILFRISRGGRKTFEVIKP